MQFKLNCIDVAYRRITMSGSEVSQNPYPASCILRPTPSPISLTQLHLDGALLAT